MIRRATLKKEGNRFDSRTGYKQEAELQPLVLLTDKSRARNRALLQELKQKLKQQMFTPYKNVHLYDAKGNLSQGWYVEYHYIIPGTQEYKRFKERFDMNRLRTLTERRSYASECLQFMKQKLKEGFNPFEQLKIIGSSVDFRIKIQMQKILNDLCRNVSPSAIATYQEHYNRFTKFIDAKGQIQLYMVQITIDHAKSYKKYLLHEMNLSVKTVNASLSYMAMYWEHAVEKKWSTANPFMSVPKAKKTEKAISEDAEERFEPLTAAEMEQIFCTLKEAKEFAFIRFLAVIFYAWPRPVEISRLRISDIDLERNLIRFRKGRTKNKRSAFVQIVPPLRKILLEIKLHEYSNTDLFLFSGDGDGFLPGKTQLTKYRAGERWRKYVKKVSRKGNWRNKTRKAIATGEGINKDMYALKHTGNIEYLLQNAGNVDLKWQQMQNRHGSSAMTDQYNRKLGVYFVDVGKMNFRHFEI
jgi:integrase